MRRIPSPFRAQLRAGFLGSAASFALISALALPAAAQVTVEDARTAPISTSTAGDGGTASDVNIGTGGSVTVTGTGPAVTLDSDNALTNSGSITIENVNDATGVSLQGGADRSYTQAGSISIVEDYTATNTDDDPFIDGPVAEGSGRTGILISGASPFQGNVEMAAGSSIIVEGNDSFGINLENTPMMMGGLTGDLTTAGNIGLTGEDGFGVNVASNVTGNLENQGQININGAGSTGYNISGDVQGGFANSGAISASGYRFASRPPFSTIGRGRNNLGTEDRLQAGSAVSVSGDITGGVHLEQRSETSTADDGTETTSIVGISAVNQFGNAPAILLDGDGSIISIGQVSAITDPDAEGYDADLLYAFVNAGSVNAQGVYDDVDATALSVANATLEGGINNTGSLQSSTFRAPTALEEDRGTGLARVIVLGDQAMADRINNSGLILATASEALDEAFADAENPLAARNVSAIAIDIGANSTAGSLTNSGTISAFLIAREGRAVAIQDASGTLTSLDNTGLITTITQNPDTTDTEDTSYELIAIDVSANTAGFTLTQSRAVDTDPDDDVTPSDPNIRGSILMGSGDDSITATAGNIFGDTVAFGAGNDTLTLSGGSTLLANVTNSGGLTIDVSEESTLALGAGTPLPITTANFDGTSTFRPVVDGATGLASTLQATGDITFAAGATIAPILNNLSFAPEQRQDFTIAEAANLIIADEASLALANQPFLFNTSFDYDQGSDTLVLTLDLRDSAELVAAGGLDQVGAAAYGATLEALSSNNDLGNAFANISSAGDFTAAYNQILPEFAAAARQFVVSNVDGATGAVGTHLDTARRSPDKPGGAWLQEFAYFVDRDLAGLSEQYRGAGFGFTGGLDTALGPFHAVGVNFGFASTEIEDVVGIDDPLDVITLQGGLYAGLQSGNLGIEAYAGGGYNKFEQERRVRINEFFGGAKGDWNGTHINGSLRAGYDIELSEKFWIRPTASVDYLRLSEKAYSETGDAGVALAVDKRTSDMGSATGMINLGAKFQGKRTWIRPSIRAGYRYDFINDPVLTSYRYIGLNDGQGGVFDSQRANLESIMFPDKGFVLGFSVAAGSAYSSIGFDFDSDIRNGFVRHTGRIVIRLLF